MNESVVPREKHDVFLKELRKQTGESHEKLEENDLSRKLLSPEVDMSDYQLYIAKMYGAVRACETQVYPLVSFLFPDLSARYKADLIQNDLLKTGVSDVKIENLPVCNFAPCSVAEALGMMYVLEGSTLGGKIIYKHIHQTLGLDADSGASFFFGYGDRTGPFWKSFITTFANFAIEEQCENEIIAGAVKTFSAIDQWLHDAEINW